MTGRWRTFQRASEPPALESARAWLTVAAAFLSTFTAFGVLYSYSSFSQAIGEHFDVGKGATASLFSVTVVLYFGFGPFAGRMVVRHGPKRMLVASAVFTVGSLWATAAIGRFWLGYLSYGVGLGIAIAAGFVPLLASVGAWFDRRRPAALGVASMGIGAGTLVGVPATAWLVERFGWRTGFVALGAAGGVLLLAAAALAARPPAPLDSAPTPLGPLLRRREFAILYLNALLLAVPLFAPFLFLKPYAEAQGIRPEVAAVLVGLIGTTGVVARALWGALGARVAPLRLMQVCIAVMGCSFAVWLAAGSSFGALAVYAVLMGAGYGGFSALFPAVVAGLFGTRAMGEVLGVLYTGVGLGVLIGPPVLGVLIDRVSYGTAIGSSLVLCAAGAVVVGFAAGGAGSGPDAAPRLGTAVVAPGRGGEAAVQPLESAPARQSITSSSVVWRKSR